MNRDQIIFTFVKNIDFLFERNDAIKNDSYILLRFIFNNRLNLHIIFILYAIVSSIYCSFEVLFSYISVKFLWFIKLQKFMENLNVKKKKKYKNTKRYPVQNIIKNKIYILLKIK